MPLDLQKNSQQRILAIFSGGLLLYSLMIATFNPWQALVIATITVAGTILGEILVQHGWFTNHRGMLEITDCTQEIAGYGTIVLLGFLPLLITEAMLVIGGILVLYSIYLVIDNNVLEGRQATTFFQDLMIGILFLFAYIVPEILLIPLFFLMYMFMEAVWPGETR